MVHCSTTKSLDGVNDTQTQRRNIQVIWACEDEFEVIDDDATKVMIVKLNSRSCDC